MKRLLAISDVHGCYNEFCELLMEVKYNSNEDKLILLGDYVDRGSKSKEVVEMIMALVNEHGVVALKGNHDKMFLEFIKTGSYEDATNFFSNGGLKTIESYIGNELSDFLLARNYIIDNYKHHIDFLNSLPYYHETDQYIFVHAGINPFDQDWKQTSPEEMIWIRDIFFRNPTRTDKTVIFGHTPCLNLHGKENVWFGGDKIGIDGACCYGFQLNCLEISDDGYNTYFVDSKTRHK